MSFWTWFGNTSPSATYHGDLSIFSLDSHDFWISNILKWTLIILSFLSVLLLWIYKKPIGYNYHNQYLLRTKKNNFLIQISGVIVLICVLLRSILLVSTNFPNMWEALPLHYCRLMLVGFGVILMLKKIQCVKYLAMPSVLGAVMALSIPELRVSYFYSGADFDVIKNVTLVHGENIMNFTWKNYFFYDYFLAHIFVLLAPFVLGILFPFKWSFKDLNVTLGIFLGLITFFFVVNFLTNQYAQPEWKSNYFYLGYATVPLLQQFVPLIGRWPNILLWEYLLAIFYVYFATVIYLYQDVIIFQFKSGFRIIFRFSSKIDYFYESYLDFKFFLSSFWY